MRSGNVPGLRIIFLPTKGKTVRNNVSLSLLRSLLATQIRATCENEAYLCAPFLQDQPGREGGGKKKKQLLGFILSPVRLVSTTPASLALANQETLEPEFAV